MGTLWRLFFASAAKRARNGLFAVVLGFCTKLYTQGF